MGFYGNITNTSNTTFSFDRIYPNRLSMDANANNDGIFIGRYVLVEYEQSAAYPNIYINNGKYYSSPNFEEVTRIKYKSGGRPASDTSNDVFYLGEFGQKQESEKIYFYMCDGYETVEENLYATFKQVTAVNKDDATPYLINHNIDYEEYKNAKGYDSSVWTKVNEEKNGKLVTRYRNIADLNSVVPTFDLETDAPTMTPITPHFDADSTNVYYKLHTQPQWGLRVAAQEDENSDSTTTWQFTTYNPATDETITHEEKNKAAAINFNGPAFDAQVGKANILKHDSGENYITILPTGESGKKYYTHTNKNGEKVYEKAPDIQEVRINLPAIGNMMSDAWDIIHGPLRNDDMREFDADGKNVSSLKGRLNSIDALEDDAIPVKRDADGKLVGNKINGGKTTNTDYTGKDDDAWIETLVNGNEETITIHHTYDLDNKSNYKDIGHLEGKLNSNNDTTNNVNLNDGTNEFKINTPIVDSMGHIVGRNTETIELPYGYKYFKTEGLSDVTIDLYSKNVDKIGGHSENKTTNSIDNDTQAHNTQDTLSINPANKWIQTKLEDTSADGDILTIAHEIHSIDERDNEHQNLNTDAPLRIEYPKDTTDEVYELMVDRWQKGMTKRDAISIPDWSYDEAGHIKEKRNRIYTLPYGYKTIKVKNSDSSDEPSAEININGQSANNTQDVLNINASNKWIKLDNSEGNTVKLGHSRPFSEKQIISPTNTTVTQFGDTFNLINLLVDEAGHVIQYHEDEIAITIPEGSIIHPNSTSSNSDIITALRFNSKTGEISYDKDNTSTLKLATNYTTNEISAGAISGGDSLNTAFAKLEKQVIKEANARATDILKEVNDRNLAISSAISAIVDKDDDGTINKLAEVIDWINNNPSTATQMQTAIQDNTKAIENEKTRAENIEARLQEQINAFGNASDYATADQGTLAETAIQPNTTFTYGEEQKTIQDLMDIVINLSARIEALENPITTE